ncbi:MAG: XdhC family protein [Candidatus Aminicenantes bacterium]|nr:XdhC family protein [Candidatus Aminicenantes bacterium]
MNKSSFWEFVRECQQAGEPVLLLLVVESGGSSPGKPGFKMAVTADGLIYGTIGGGIMERKLADKAVRLLDSGLERPQLLKLLHHENRTAASVPSWGRTAASVPLWDGSGKRSGMICSGWQRLVMLPLTDMDSDAVDSLIFALKRNRPGRLKITPAGMEFQPRKTPSAGTAFTFTANDDWLYQEEAGQRPTLTIIGGGHVGLALSRVMVDLNFHVVVLDDRPSVATMSENSFANEKRLVSYKSIGRHVSEGGQCYAVIMTFGHQADELVLGQLAGKKLRYLGLMGSSAKIAQIVAHLKKKGIAAASLKKVHAPVGLPIHSHTPEEIAISIAAEIIQVKNVK